MARPLSMAVAAALLDASSQLFSERGIAATGIAAVADRAEVGKPTIYRHFGSKERLVEATLRQRHIRRREELERRLGAAEDDRSVDVIVEWIAEWIESPDFAGCAFVRALAEPGAIDGPSIDVVRSHKRWLGSVLHESCQRAGLSQPDQVARHLHLLIEGATASAHVEGHAAAARDLREATARVVSASSP